MDVACVPVQANEAEEADAEAEGAGFVKPAVRLAMGLATAVTAALSHGVTAVVLVPSTFLQLRMDLPTLKEAVEGLLLRFGRALTDVLVACDDAESTRVWGAALVRVLPHLSGEHSAWLPTDRPTCDLRCPLVGDAAHWRERAHPPRCYTSPCANTTPIHRALWSHPFCPGGADCNSADDAHMAAFNHPPPCADGTSCSNTDRAHLAAFMHPQSCARGRACPKLNTDPDHAARYKHELQVCRNGDGQCHELWDRTHMQLFAHSCRPLCPQSPYACSDTTPAHNRAFAHWCEWGHLCSRKRDEEHAAVFVHRAKVCGNPRG
jgi:hypothetical protein